MRYSMPKIATEILVGLVLLFALTGCAGKQPVLRTDEAIPSSVAELDEATDLVSQRHVSNFKLCVQRSKLVDDSDLDSHPMWLVFTINPDGKAEHVKIISERFKGTAFASCVTRILTWIYFPTKADEARQVRLQLWLDGQNPLRGSK